MTIVAQQKNIEKRPGYKHTPLGWIPEEWHSINFGDIADKKIKWSITGGPFGSNLKASDYTEEGIRIIQLQNIGDGEFIDSYKIYTSINKADELLSCNIYPGEIIVSKMGDPVARACIIPNTEKRYLMASDGIRLVVNNILYDKYYIFHFINSWFFRKRAIAASTGSTRQRIGLDDLKQLQVVSPPLPEQRKIAAILSTWDDAIQQTQALIKQLVKRNKGLAQQLLRGRKRLKGFEGQWKYEQIRAVAKDVSIKNKEGKGLTVLSCTKYDGLVPSLEYFGRRVFGSDTSTYKVVPRYHFAYATNHIEEGSIGYQADFEEALISPMYTVFKVDDSVDDTFLFKVLKSHNYIHEYNRRMEGSIDRRGGLRWDEFSKIKIPVPDIKEQQAIAAVLDKATDELQQKEQYFTALQQQKKGLMQQLLTGAVRVKIDSHE